MEKLHNILIQGIRTHNLRNVRLEIPWGKLVAFAGPSGSGKSSLVFSTIAAEATRQLQELFPPYLRNPMPHQEEPEAETIDYLTTPVVIQQRAFQADYRSTVGTMTDAAPLLRLLFSRCAEPSVGDSSCYSPNDPRGMCPACSGLGRSVSFDWDKILDKTRSLNEGAILFPAHGIGSYQWQLYANCPLLDPDKPLSQYSEREWQDFLHGSGPIVPIQNVTGKVWDNYSLKYEGLAERLSRLYLKRDLHTLNASAQRIVEEFTTVQPCLACGGTRLRQEVLESRLLGMNIYEAGELEIRDLRAFLRQITDPKGRPIVRKLDRILEETDTMGLGYLTLNRAGTSLSGGESQRLRMVRHFGSSLVGLTYIFDEPTAGLHPRDIEHLGTLLRQLRDRGNTVLVVEHNRQMLRLADQVIELGPGAGREGGRVVFQGTIDELTRSDTMTGAFLRTPLTLKSKTRAPEGYLTVEDATLHNLRHVSVQIPKQVLTVVSGMAGAGKTSLICGELCRRYPEIVQIGADPVGKNSRSTPATYLGIMDRIRKQFADANGVSAGMFSFNGRGACPHCGGRGVIKTEMAFLDPVTMPCEVCGGRKYSEETLQYRLRGKTILDVLEMTVEEAAAFFDDRKIQEKLHLMQRVGLG